MRKFVFFSLILSLLVNTVNGQRGCGTVEHYQMISAQDPSILQNRDAIEQFTQNFVQSGAAASSRSVITIPVVVHVVYNTPDQNISDAQILSQITALNQDFRKLNSDWVNTPACFQGLVADVGIQFGLAQRDPNGNATNGIIRKSTSVTVFYNDDKMKFNSTGGDDAWPASSYLNIWVCNLAPGLGGYSQYPGAPANVDGITVRCDGFGTIGTAAPNYSLGRSATHEIGHYLNLIHIWGDDQGACTGSDNVDDTPPQGNYNFYCPSFPTISCNNGPNGDMFMNYMDYANDVCSFMFTQGQKARMQALFAPGGWRAPLLNSLGCQPPNATACPIPFNPVATNIAATSATVSWSVINTATSYNVKYKATSSSTWSNITCSSASYNLTGLTASTTYDFQVQSVCSSGPSTFSTQGSFTTASGTPCGVPAGLNSSCITQTTATLSWSPVAGSSGYNFQFKRSSSISYTTNFTTNANCYMTGLTAGEIYDFRVQAVCGTATSNYSSPSTFTALTPTSCGIPFNLVAASITSTSASISWFPANAATSYNIQYKASTASNWSTLSTSSTSISLTGLASGTSYNYQVQAVCSSGNSAFSIGSTFTTLAGSPVCNTPGGVSCPNVTQTSSTLIWNAVSSANYYVIAYKPSTSTAWNYTSSTTPTVLVPSLLAATTYDYQIQAGCSFGISALTPVYNFTTVDPNSSCGIPAGLASSAITETSATLAWGAVGGATGYNVVYKPSSSTTWSSALPTTSVSISLNSLTGGTSYDYKIQAVCSSGNSQFSTVNSFSTIQTLVPCGTPSGLSSSNIAQTTASLSWGLITGALSYNIQYKPSSSTTWSSALSSTTANFALTGLTASTGYDYKVQTICSGGSSIYSTTYSFTTLAPVVTCGTPSGLSSASVTQNFATLSWGIVTGATGYSIQYKPSLSTTWSTLSSTTNALGLSGLTASTSYDYRVQTICSSGSSTYSLTSTFITQAVPVTCDAPTVFSNTNITQTSSTVSWTATAGATGYNVQYKENSAAAWNVLFTLTPSINLSGLTAGVTYVYQIQTICSAGSSGFSTVYSFTTSAPVITCDVPSGLTNNNVSQYSATGVWTGCSSATLYNVQYKLSSSTIWSTLSTAAASINFTGLQAQTSYDYKVQTVCSTGGSSYSTPVSFITLPPASSPICVDNFEPNNAMSSAVDITVNSDMSALITSTTDVDYFKFTISNSAQKYIRISLTNLPADYDVKLLKSNGTTLAQAQHSGLVNEIIKYTKAVAGTYYVQIYSRNHVYNASSCFTMNASVSTTALLKEIDEPDYDAETVISPEISLYPNPSSGIASLDMNVDELLDYVEVQVYDMLGKQIRNDHYPNVTGYFKANIDLSNVTNGIYNVLINTPLSNETRKLIIAK